MVRCGDKLKKLSPGQSFTVPVNTKHCFFNTKETPVKALIELNPGSEGFENGIKIAYGLTRDGQCNAKGLPKRLDHMTLLFEMSEGRVPGLLSLMMPIFLMVAQKARANGMERN